MRKYLLCSVLSAALFLSANSASATDLSAIPTAENLIQIIPVDLQRQAKTGSHLTENPDLTSSKFTLEWGENNGTDYIIKISVPEQDTSQNREKSKYGVFDFATNQWRIPCKYDGIYFIPDHRYFLVIDGEEKSLCYEAESDGTINPESLPINGKVSWVDRQGYVTLYHAFEVEIKRYDGLEPITVPYCLSALLDNHYQMVLDYVAGSDYPGRIMFEDGVALIRTGGTGFYAANYETGWSDSTVGFINRKGEWVGKHNYYDAYCFENDGSNERTWARLSTGKTYWIVEDGGEVEVDSPFSGTLQDKCSDWAKEAIEQAKSRGLISEKMQGYYTLDAYREELCSLLVNLYRQLGRELPVLDATPTFIDCEREHVRIAAALGIVSGNDNREIHPRSRITRQEAADMLYRFTALFRKLDSSPSAPYPDDTSIDSRFKPQIYAMQNIGIMNGIPGGNFAPNDYYSIEQAIFAVNRLYDLLSK